MGALEMRTKSVSCKQRGRNKMKIPKSQLSKKERCFRGSVRGRSQNEPSGTAPRPGRDTALRSEKVQVFHLEPTYFERMK
eukprot:scaffold7846_cov240-Ochromonas_danica.AAC.1